MPEDLQECVPGRVIGNYQGVGPFSRPWRVRESNDSQLSSGSKPCALSTRSKVSRTIFSSGGGVAFKGASVMRRMFYSAWLELLIPRTY